ncbi:helix-turn-helix domain-containing protein [Lysinibacillus capsici]|uniref:Helix-turn-helix domain-containing protein n=1 Tax=Lysinibacillus capsici TaxID=2115968 RepID=A0ABY8KGU4_9BACI|nr:helix-turn-helix domain-containing protein [Lysinibacillus capsici]MDP1395132.1 helix-turn-helix domain-containing protein [Lysinibacillus capsici]MDP1415369.1 helix-turn-helix domain-containing protein [Lysinibacillus capsici]MDP1431495.1 helix-turn-helix domain-containing protein [Lysinibacillus capsici]WGF36855.1 helix-turn-helix domain-containing protein [Lysinibacillus capsici]
MNLTSLYIRLQHYDRFQVDRLMSATSHNEGINNHETNLCTLLIALSPAIRLYVDKMAIDLRQGSCMLILPIQSYTVESSNKEAQLARFTFETFEVEGMTLNRIAHPPLLHGYPYHLLFSQVKQVLGNEASNNNQFCSSLSTLEMAMLQGRLQQILAMMVQLDEQANQLQHEEKTKLVQQTVQYIEQHYDEDLTVEQLANMAGMVRWQYSQKFKILTGKKPTDYLTHVRINQAKKILSNSTEPLRKIARQIGFKDEYYFSRCFHKLTGNTPREYANIQLHTPERTVIDSFGRKIHVPKDATRIVTDGKFTLGELLVLGIPPIGAAISIMKDNVVYHNKLRNIHSIGHWVDPDKIAQLQPELLLLSYFHPEHDLQKLDAIAPTIILNSKFSLFERLRYIAKLFERSKAAEKWISTYENKVRLVRRQLADVYVAGETATVYLKLDTKYYVMCQTGLAASLYESLGFRPTPQVMQLIEQGQAWIEIQQHQINHYAGERNFILASPKELLMITYCPQIATLIELAPGKTHFIDFIWNHCDPITRERLLEVLPSIFKKKVIR